MLLKKNRANREDLNKVFKNGLFLSSPNLSFRYIKALDNKISFITPKTVSKSAVKRNFLRRKGYFFLKKHINLLKSPAVGAFLFKKNNIEDLENEIKNILNRVN